MGLVGAWKSLSCSQLLKVITSNPSKGSLFCIKNLKKHEIARQDEPDSRKAYTLFYLNNQSYMVWNLEEIVGLKQEPKVVLNGNQHRRLNSKHFLSRKM